MRELTRLALVAVLPIAVLSLPGCKTTPPEGVGETGLAPPSCDLEHLFLITADTWRGDHFLASLGDQPLTPGFAQLMTSGTVFPNNSSVAAMTSPGTAGILSGLLPQRSGVLENPHMLPSSVRPLAVELQDHGFDTAGFVANPVLGPGFGFESGFEHYRLITITRPNRKARAGALVKESLAWLDQNQSTERRLFLWLHFMEPHGPYEPQREVLAAYPRSLFGESERPVPLLPRGNQTGFGGVPNYQWDSRIYPGEVDARSYLARYAAEVREYDDGVGALVRGLEERGLLACSLLVTASDHGEALEAENGYYFSHANPPTRDQLHTPLAFFYPGADGSTKTAPTSNLDIFPTVLDLLGLDRPQYLDGTSLLGELEPRIISARYSGYRALRLGEWKLVTTTGGETTYYRGLTGEVEVEAAAVPAETLLEFASETERQDSLETIPSIDRFDLSEEQKKELEALGYVQ